MKKKNVILISVVIIILIVAIGLIVWFINREYPDDENSLYSIKFDDFKLRFQRYDYALGQNQLVAVEKSTNKGKTYEKTDEFKKCEIQNVNNDILKKIKF